MVKYRQLNLLADFSQLGTFDLIFCRNVLIYFDQETKIDVLNRLARVTASDGYLRARRRRNRGRAHRQLQDRGRQARALCAECDASRLSATGAANPRRAWSPSTAGDRQAAPGFICESILVLTLGAHDDKLGKRHPASVSAADIACMSKAGVRLGDPAWSAIPPAIMALPIMAMRVTFMLRSKKVSCRPTKNGRNTRSTPTRPG